MERRVKSGWTEGEGERRNNQWLHLASRLRDDFTSEAQGGYVVHRTCTYVYTCAMPPPHTHITLSVY